MVLPQGVKMNALVKVVAPAINFKRIFNVSLKKFSFKKFAWEKQNFQQVEQARKFQEEAIADRLKNSQYL